MPNDNLISFNLIVDRSGSMNSLTEETVGGINKLLADQKSAPGEVLFSLTVFDDKVEMLHDSVNLKDVPELTTQAYWSGGGGWTALRDALGITINRVKDRLDTLPENLKPGKVLFTVITDGAENHSTEYSPDKIQSLIKEAREQWKWEFTMLGANIDSLGTAAGLGVSSRNAINFNATKGGMAKAVAAASAGTLAYRAFKGNSHGMGLYAAQASVDDLPDDSVQMEAVFTSYMNSQNPASEVIFNPIDNSISGITTGRFDSSVPNKSATPKEDK